MTYAIFKAAGFQYRAELGDVLRLPSLDVESGDTVTFDEVLLGATEGDVLIGRPTLKGAAVRAEVLGHGRADKVVVFKFKRRKNIRSKTGHRQDYTEVRVSEIDFGGDRRVSLEKVKKAAPKKKAAKKPVAKAAAAKPKKAPAKKKAAPKAKAKTTAKKKTTAKAKSTSKAKTTTKAKAKTTSKKKKS
ncbi:MAG: 50S ribosomal protein L21 [Gemmatimonadetes bacterium]|nr:50S ribosomal protein L21 [Gemmatimonadota bacterium]NIO33214.1 50S ribosomal protein L21 [Gemmatimonadota bacterium]